MLVELPTPDYRLQQRNITDFPSKAKLTPPRLNKEMYDAQSTDFSFWMSPRELQWHQLVLKDRLNTRVKSVEYMWKAELEGIFVMGNLPPTFSWSTPDSKWKGAIYFASTTEDDLNWIRHLCATLALDGDLAELQALNEADIEALLRVQSPRMRNK